MVLATKLSITAQFKGEVSAGSRECSGRAWSPLQAQEADREQPGPRSSSSAGSPLFADEPSPAASRKPSLFMLCPLNTMFERAGQVQSPCEKTK